MSDNAYVKITESRDGQGANVKLVGDPTMVLALLTAGIRGVADEINESASVIAKVVAKSLEELENGERNDQ